MRNFGTKKLLHSLALAALLGIAWGGGADAQEKSGGVSEKTLKTLKLLAWQSLPSKIILADKRVVEIDKSDPKQIIIPDEDAQRIIRVAHLTARAHQCDLQELVIANRDALMKAEKALNKWSESQLHYINTLHLYTVQLLVGKIEVAEEGKDPTAAPPPKPAETPQCSESEKKEILAAVEANEKKAGKS
jgi:hypothetical protein